MLIKRNAISVGHEDINRMFGWYIKMAYDNEGIYKYIIWSRSREKEGGKEVYSDFTDLAEKLKKLKK